MQTKLLTLGLRITSASLLFGQQTSRHFGSSMPILPASLMMAQDQAPTSHADEKHDKKNEKKPEAIPEVA